MLPRTGDVAARRLGPPFGCYWAVSKMPESQVLSIHLEKEGVHNADRKA